MNEYFENLNETIKEYFKVLLDEVPGFLYDYINITAMQRIDKIKLDEVDDYHIYPIADNDTPKLSADRLEYTFANGLYLKKVWDVQKIKKIYSNIEIQINEDGVGELGFKDKKIAEEFIEGASQLWSLWASNEDKLAMQFLADTVRKMSEEKFLTKKDLYTLSEKEVIDRIENCANEKISKCFKLFRNSTKISESDSPVLDKYCVSITTKRRYIVPLVKYDNSYKRINEISGLAKEKINDYLNFKTKKYAYLDFDF